MHYTLTTWFESVAAVWAGGTLALLCTRWGPWR